jgi:flavin reductase (DIM6/NTAB) family NADH-FMN oxidoreductase RutF
MASPEYVTLPVDEPLWERVFMPAPLVVVGTREPDGGHDLAPKHMASPMSWQAWFGFVCAPTHRTWDNAVRTGAFTVSYLGPEQVLLAAFAAGPREDDASKPTLAAVPVRPAQVVGGVLVEGCPLQLECELDRVVAGLGDNGLILGRVVAAHVHRDALRAQDRDDADLLQERPLLVYVHPNRFARVAHTDRLPLHTGFKR